jgi:threonine dehydratase
VNAEDGPARFGPSPSAGSGVPRQPDRVTDRRLSLERIARAAATIDRVFLDSPQYRVESLEEPLGCRVLVKVETLNPIRSFKGRGADWYVASLDPAPRLQSGESRPHLVCATAGNFGQGMAYAARKRGVPITVFTGRDANPLKVERMRGFGADVRLAADMDAAFDDAASFAAESGARLVVDGRDPAIGEGAGTIGIELLRWPEPLDTILVPLGDGSLLAGIARWVKAHQAATRMVGVCAAGAPAMERSWRAGRVEVVQGTGTIADGLAVTAPFPEALTDITGLVDDILLVPDEALLDAMRLAHRELGLVLEPSGAAGLAAVIAHGGRFRDQLVGVILTGGNLTPDQIRRWLAAPSS